MSCSSNAAQQTHGKTRTEAGTDCNEETRCIARAGATDTIQQDTEEHRQAARTLSSPAPAPPSSAAMSPLATRPSARTATPAKAQKAE